MASDQQKREQLVQFLDCKVFAPILCASPERYDGDAQKRKLADVQNSSEREKQRFQHEYRTAKDVGSAYLNTATQAG